jgi:hypothetical protein
MHALEPAKLHDFSERVSAFFNHGVVLNVIWCPVGYSLTI